MELREGHSGKFTFQLGYCLEIHCFPLSEWNLSTQENGMLGHMDHKTYSVKNCEHASSVGWFDTVSHDQSQWPSNEKTMVCNETRLKPNQKI